MVLATHADFRVNSCAQAPSSQTTNPDHTRPFQGDYILDLIQTEVAFERTLDLKVVSYNYWRKQGKTPAQAKEIVLGNTCWTPEQVDLFDKAVEFIK